MRTICLSGGASFEARARTSPNVHLTVGAKRTWRFSLVVCVSSVYTTSIHHSIMKNINEESSQVWHDLRLLSYNYYLEREYEADYADFGRVKTDSSFIDSTRSENAHLGSPPTLHKLRQSGASRSSLLRNVYDCPACDISTTRYADLQRHRRSKHGKSRAYQCHECDKAFSRKDMLDRHRRERHEKIEPVECMNCGKLVKDISLRDHLESDRCRRHGKDVGEQPYATSTSTDAHASTLVAILQQYEHDSQVFTSLTAGGVCEPLSASTYFSHSTMQEWGVLKSSQFVSVPEEIEAEIHGVRGLTTRSIIRRLATGLVDDALDGAIRTFALTERMLFPKAADIHDAAVKWLDMERFHRLLDVLKALKSNLNQWNTLSIRTRSTKSSPIAEDSRPLQLRRYTKVRHEPEPINSSENGTSAPHLPSAPPDPGSSSINSVGINSIVQVDDKSTQVAQTSSSKPKRKVEDAQNDRCTKQKTCNLDGCSTVLLQRTLARHIREVHGQGEIHQCVHCTKAFFRKGTLNRHYDEKHGEKAQKVQCERCGKHVYRRALKDHLTRSICQVKESVEDVDGVEMSRDTGWGVEEFDPP